MSRLDKLINEYCPDGVEYVRIGDVTNYIQPSRYIVKSTKYDDKYDTPVLTAGQTFILGYTDETEDIFPASKENPVIIFDDFTGAFKWVDFGFKVKSSAMKILTADENKTTLRYIFHVMGYLGYTSSEHKRLWIGIYSDFRIPVPPLPVQCEIVRILDNFTELTAELTAELNKRQKQYSFYRSQMVSFDETVPRRKIGDICDVFVGGEAPADCIKGSEPDDEHSFPVWGNGRDVYGYAGSYTIQEDAVCISSIGANTGDVFYHKGKFTPIIRLKVIVPKTSDVNNRYLYHAVSTVDFAPKKSSVPNMSASDIKKAVIPLPDIEIQRKIADILDKFDDICNDLSSGIPAEINARQKQYEYYRDKLLTFEEKRA